MSPEERGKVPGIKPERGDLILAGALAVQTVMEIGAFDALEVTEAGLREGVFYSTLLEGRDPPLFEDVRRDAVLNLAATYDADFAHVEHVARLALGMWDALGEARVHPCDPRERDLLWAAAMLHDIGTAVDYDDHHKHSRYLILNAGLPGYTTRETALIGQMARYHRKGNPSLGLAAALARDGDEEALTRCAALLRLGEQLERSRDQAVREAHVGVDDEPRRPAPRGRRGRQRSPAGRAESQRDALRARLRAAADRQRLSGPRRGTSGRGGVLVPTHPGRSRAARRRFSPSPVPRAPPTRPARRARSRPGRRATRTAWARRPAPPAGLADARRRRADRGLRARPGHAEHPRPPARGHDGRSFAEREREDATHRIKLADPRSLTYRQVNTARSGRWRITKTYVTDPRRAAVLVDLHFESLVWDDAPPAGRSGHAPGTGTLSATPLAWTHAQFIRLAWSIDAGRPVERPAVVACRYAKRCR